MTVYTVLFIPSVGLGLAKIRFYKLIPTTFGSIEDGSTPFLGTVLHRVMKLISDLPQYIPAHRILIAIGTEEHHDSLRVLERFDQPVEQNPIEAAISESNAILVMLVESVHGKLLCGEIPGA